MGKNKAMLGSDCGPVVRGVVPNTRGPGSNPVIANFYFTLFPFYTIFGLIVANLIKASTMVNYDSRVLT